MRGYRCDNCRDFQPQVVVPDETNIFTRTSARLPPSWVTLVTGDDSNLHFCSPACVAAYVETLMREEVEAE